MYFEVAWLNKNISMKSLEAKVKMLASKLCDFEASDLRITYVSQLKGGASLIQTIST